MSVVFFSIRAKSIKNTALVNKDISQKALLSAYQQEIKKLKSMLQDRSFCSESQINVQCVPKAVSLDIILVLEI